MSNEIVKIKKTLFNDGLLSVECVKDGAKELVFKNVPFGDETLTENRFNSAMATGNRVDRVVHIPYRNALPENAYIYIGVEKFTIYKQQIIKSSNPPIIVLTLKAFK